MNGIIYRIFNLINGKSYIGKSYSGFYNRLQEHLNDRHRYSTRPLYRAFNKYGLESFSAEILGEFEEGVLESKEVDFIKEYESYGRGGYNATLGGDGRRTVKVDNEKLVSIYRQLGTIAATAGYFGIDKGTCTKLLGNNLDNSLFNTKEHKRKCLSKRVLIKDVGLEFSDPYECARFLLDCEIIDSSVSERNAGISIGRACRDERKTYKGLYITYID